MAIRTKTLRRFLALFLGALMISASPGAYAQEDPFSEFFGGLFGGGRPHRGGDYGEPRVRRIAPGRERGPAYWHGQSEQRRAKRQQTPAPAEETPAVEPTFFVATLGDTLGVLLASGLKQGLSDKLDVAILSKAKESSGLAREDFYDWKKAAHEIAGDAQKVNVAVIMLGSNDRQAIQQGAESYEPFSPRWREIYAARVDAVIAAFQEKGIPVIWVGLPVMKNERFSADMAQLNEIFRARVEKAGAAYIDIWEAMADEHGQYSAFGPDINGQIVKLRSADGVHFTDAGARSVAHFVETEIKRIYDEYRERTPLNAAAPPAAAPPPDGGARPAAAVATPGEPLVFRPPVASGPSAAPALPDRPAIGPTQQLTGAGAASELAKRTPVRATDSPAPAQALARHVFVQGGDQNPRPNRADDYRWRPPAPAAEDSPQR